MAFSGENSSLGVSAHLHSNVTGQGGSLDGTTLISNAPLFAMMVALG